jgi:hypothetical protein
MLRLKFAAGPAIPLLELNSKQIICFLKLAILYAGLTTVGFELQRDNGIGWNRLLKFEACARWRDVLQNGPFTACGPEFRFPLHFYKICTKLSIFSSHALVIGKLIQGFRRFSLPEIPAMHAVIPEM